MKLRDKARLLSHLLRWRLRWDRRDLDHHPGAGVSERFVTVRDAVARIPDGATVISSGMAGNARCSAFFWGVSERFAAEGAPRGLTWLSVGAQGGRGRAPGTVEELAAPGLLARYISGHVETAKALLDLAERGELAIHVLPQGEMARLIAGQAAGRYSLTSPTGVGTFLDPRCGTGSPVCASDDESLIAAADDGLEYRLPRIDVALFAASYADRDGNVYFRDMATLTESVESVRAVRRNGGLAMAVVQRVDEPGGEAIGVAAADLDAVCVNPWNEQTVAAWQGRPWRLFSPGGDGDDHEAIERLRFVSRLLRITPVRGPVEEALGRLGATLFSAAVPAGAHINIGVGYPEEVCREVCESPLRADYTFTTETGVYGGVPAPGIYFGAAVNPDRLESSAWMFRFYLERLDATVLGLLQVDSAGNVNVSRRGPAITDYVGPGGFPSIVQAADTVIFVGTWMTGAKWRIHRDELELVRPGRPKFVERVDEVTFSGPQALADGKRVYYVTHIGVIELTERGLELVWLMPGIDPARDVFPHTGARITLARETVPVSRSVVTGRGFDLRSSTGRGPLAGRDTCTAAIE
jgi:propionate CoA-transferase